MTVVATGGLAHLFRPDIPAIEHVDPDLTIRGLMLIHARNVAKAPRNGSSYGHRDRTNWSSCLWAGRARSA